ncbi:hypothetical protein BG006_010111 [Podila minutissima]|uniref:Uncharacterized protein n=1 Tax=Podila minutissima TaxID=64525 RepID=A0A9P5SQI7_9FUNG|nr:hypothetical protein BG006_010111 [Podila minutissima]
MHGKDRVSTVKSLLASILGKRAPRTASSPSPSMASSVKKKVIKSDPLRSPSDAKQPQLVYQRQEEAKVIAAILPNAPGQMAASKSKKKKKTSTEALDMIGAAIGAEGSASSAFETAEAICDDSDNNNFIKRTIHQLTHDGHHVPQSDAGSANSKSADTMSVSENDSSTLSRKNTFQFLHQRDFEQDEPSKQEQGQFDRAPEETQPTYQFEDNLEEEGILESFANVVIGPSPADEQSPNSDFDDDQSHYSYKNYVNDWIQYVDRKGATALTAVLATLVLLDTSTWSGPQVAIAFTFATFVAFVLLTLCISFKMHRRRARRLGPDASASSSSLDFFHYLTCGVFDLKRHRQRHSLAALSPFSKEASTYFTLPTYRDTKTVASNNETSGPSYASTATSASVPGASGRSEIRRTSVARQLSMNQAQAVQQHAQGYAQEPLYHLPTPAPTF